MRVLELLLAGALLPFDWIHKGTKQVGLVLEYWRVRVRRRSELREMERRKA